jgi:periplasmic protein TonB
MPHFLPCHYNRPAVIAIGVAVLHLGALAALQSGLLVRAYEMVVPVEVISQIITPPQAVQAAQTAKDVQAPMPREHAKPSQARPSLLPQAPATASIPMPAPNAPAAQISAAAPAALSAEPVSAPSAVPSPLPIDQPPVPLTKPASPAAPERVSEPEMVAEHQASEELFRPSRASIQLGEFGQVGLLVTVGIDGRAKEAVVAKSSGFSRLDQSAMRGAMQARYKPAQRGGQAVERKFSWSITYPEPQR